MVELNLNGHLGEGKMCQMARSTLIIQVSIQIQSVNYFLHLIVKFYSYD